MAATVPKYRLFLINNFWILLTAGLTLFCDLASGAFALSIFVCPIWFVVTVIRSHLARTKWKIALTRALIPVLILGIALANTFIQWKIADANGERIVKACDSFYSDNGRYPQTLNELVPGYLPSIPPANYSIFGDFHYCSSRDSDKLDGSTPILWWDQFLFQHKIYSFDRRGWHHLD